MKRLIVFASLLVSGCGDLALEDRPCPCVAGWTCCEDANVCVSSGAACPGPFVVTPEPARLRLGATQAFSASAAVTWSVVEAGGGSIDASGMYRAPLRPGTYHVLAKGDGGQEHEVAVTVGPQELALVAGKPGAQGHADGFGTDARFRGPTHLAGDDTYLYVSDFWSVRRMKLDSGEVTTLVPELWETGPLALTASGLYAAVKQQIIHVDPMTGALELVAGEEQSSGWHDGTGSGAEFASITAMTADDAGALYVSDQGFLLRKVSSAGNVTTVAVSQWASDNGYVPAAFDSVPRAPFGVADQISVHAGFVYIVDSYASDEVAMWRYDPSTSTFDALVAPADSNTLLASTFSGLCFDGDGAPLLLHEHAVLGPFDSDWKPRWKWVTAGSVTESGDVDGVGDLARFARPQGIFNAGAKTASLDDDVLYVADTDNYKIRSVHLSGANWVVGSAAGESPHEGVENGVGGAARLLRPHRLTAAPDGTLFAAEFANSSSEGFSDRIRRIDPNAKTSFVTELGVEFPGGYIGGMTVAEDTLFVAAVWQTGQGVLRLSEDSGWVDVTCDEPQPHASLLYEDDTYFGIVYDGARYLYVANGITGSIERLDLDAAEGDCLPRTVVKAGFAKPRELAIDASRGALFASDDAGIHRLDLTSGELTLLAAPDVGWGPIEGLGFDPAGVLYVLPEWVHDPDGYPDQRAHRVLALVVETGEIYDLVGVEGREGVQLGSLPAGLNTPSALALLPDGSLAIADQWENAVLVAR